MPRIDFGDSRFKILIALATVVAGTHPLSWLPNHANPADAPTCKITFVRW